MGDSTAFTFNPQGPPDSDGVGGAGVVAAGTGDPAANAGGAAPFQFWSKSNNPSTYYTNNYPIVEISDANSPNYNPGKHAMQEKNIKVQSIGGFCCL